MMASLLRHRGMAFPHQLERGTIWDSVGNEAAATADTVPRSSYPP